MLQESAASYFGWYFEEYYYILNLKEFIFTMTVDDVEVPDDIWLSKYWMFEPNDTVYSRATYMLTVTDELLNSLQLPK